MKVKNELFSSLFEEVEKLNNRYELSKNIGDGYYEPGMMEFLDKSYGVYNEETESLVIRFEVAGTRYEGRTEYIEYLRKGDTVTVVRDKTNCFNPNNFYLESNRKVNIGNIPASLCNVMAPLFDRENLVIEKSVVSYVEPISKRSKHAKKAVLFVELACRLVVTIDTNHVATSFETNDYDYYGFDDVYDEFDYYDDFDDEPDVTDENIIAENNPNADLKTADEIESIVSEEFVLTKPETFEMTVVPDLTSKMPEGKCTLFAKLRKRIVREFKKVTYIGDIQISDDEYDTLIRYVQVVFDFIKSNRSHSVVDPVFAVALVQIGIKNYNGKYWTHVSKYIEGGLTAVYQGWIGRSFVATLSKYDKIHVSADEMVNNILMHSFITQYYAEDFFNFLFAYYQRDLDRDLTRHTKEMRNHLIQSMKKGENSARTYKIKKHTSDAVTANEIGCKIRIRRILQFMDNYFFKGELPGSGNRVTQLFINWAKNSDVFEKARKEYSGLGKRGQKRFSSPYFKFNMIRNSVDLVLPSQIVRLDDDELLADISWKIRFASLEFSLEAECDGSVTGCRTRTINDFSVESGFIFNDFTIELIKNKTEVVRKFVIKSDCVRFFDEDGDMINYIDYLPAGDVYAFTKPDDEIISDAIVGAEKKIALNLYTLSLVKGDVVKLPDGKARPVGKGLEEGILIKSFVDGVRVADDENIHVYSSAPLVYFSMEEKLEAGTVIEIDTVRYRFNVDYCLKFASNVKSDKFGYILKLDSFGLEEGIHEIAINIPNDRKNRVYRFAFIKDFGFDFIEAPYIFKETGRIRFKDNITAEALDDFVSRESNLFEFDILPDEDTLSFKVKASTQDVVIKIDIPTFKWKFDDEEWEVSNPEMIWYTEFPNRIYLKFPGEKVRLFMNPPETVDISFDSDDDNYEASFFKNKDEQIFECDTTKMFSWFGRHDPIRRLYIDFDSERFVFARVITKCILHSCDLDADYTENKLLLRCDISGIADCFVDITYKDKLIAEKARVTTRGVRIDAPLDDGKYSVVFYEQDEDEDEFGFGVDDYVEFDQKDCFYKNPYDFTNKIINVESISKKEKQISIFKAATYDLYPKWTVSALVKDDTEAFGYLGEIKMDGSKDVQKVKIVFPDYKNLNRAYIYCYSFLDGNCYDFCYNFSDKRLINSKYVQLTDRNILKLTDSMYYFNVSVKERKGRLY